MVIENPSRCRLPLLQFSTSVRVTRVVRGVSRQVSMILSAMKEVHYAVNPTRNAKQQALDVIKRLKVRLPFTPIVACNGTAPNHAGLCLPSAHVGLSVRQEVMPIDRAKMHLRIIVSLEVRAQSQGSKS